ncbi:unnamed protein product [Vicia faba]|uniref:Uncharacterized protein n=1 Tax=Vicia faba TaxID=3906 RepID=A0AAV0Z7V1_VICFA|nr:unnamed protein product [Vicia faba]
MEARLEFLERAYEGFVAIKEEIHEMRNLMESEKYESQRQIDQLLETVRGLTTQNDNIGYVTQSSQFWIVERSGRPQKWNSGTVFSGMTAI